MVIELYLQALVVLAESARAGFLTMGISRSTVTA